ncbi:hypothetical protein EJD97_015570 [Solanum chilense]|uniref:Uncharacterized protein n=1 Tax=Solanum chilense TaxID=4083 RepID=A0A6N2B6M4_SOLCI|nr:hypothetical protein EJD97_015570 [Solanum chilense]
MRPPECLLGSGRSQADAYNRRRKDPHYIVPGERKFDRGLERRCGRKGLVWILDSLCEPYAVRVEHTVTKGIRMYTCSGVLRRTHPICSMIFGSTRATHFYQLAKILTRYEIAGARSSGIFMGILFVVVGRPPISGRVGWVVPLYGQSS